jgi:hypothetical protein
MTEARFDVWLYYPDDWHEKVGDDLSAEDAVRPGAATRRGRGQVGMTEGQDHRAPIIATPSA